MSSSSRKTLCRACSKSSSRLKPVTKVDKKLKMTIKTSLSMITGIDCSEDDVICQKCLKQLIKCTQFIEQCEESDAKLNEQTSSGYETLENDDTKNETDSNDPSEIDEVRSGNGQIEEEIVDESITPEISKSSDTPQVIKMVKFDDPLEEVYESDFEDCTSYDDEPSLDVDQTVRKRKNTKRIKQKSKKLDQDVDDGDYHFCTVCSKYLLLQF